MSRDGLVETLVISAFCGLSYWFGKKDAEKAMIKNIEELNREVEINKLKIEIEQLKKNQAIS